MQNLNFSQALEAIKEGEAVARKGWNGPNMFIFKSIGNTIDKGFILHFTSVPLSVKKFLLSVNEDVIFEESITLFTAKGTLQPGWIPSQKDLFAEDWFIITE